MSWTLKAENGKVVSMYNTLDKKEVYQDARNYLLSCEHRRNELQNKLDKITSRFKNYWDYECDELQNKIESIPINVRLIDSFGRKEAEYCLTSFGDVVKDDQY